MAQTERGDSTREARYTIFTPGVAGAPPPITEVIPSVDDRLRDQGQPRLDLSATRGPVAPTEVFKDTTDKRAALPHQSVAAEIGDNPAVHAQVNRGTEAAAEPTDDRTPRDDGIVTDSPSDEPSTSFPERMRAIVERVKERIPKRDTREEKSAKILGGVRGVGPEKPLGFLPVDAIRMHGGDPDVLEAEAAERGLFTMRIGPEEGSQFGRSLYVADLPTLGALLEGHADMLDAAGWPTDPRAFIDRVSTEIAPSKTPLFDLIADAFADPTNRGRTDMK